MRRKKDREELPKEEAELLLALSEWTFAKTMPWHPHWYTLRKNWEDDNLFVRVVEFIRKHGTVEQWGKTKYTYYTFAGFKYWTMGCPLHNCPQTGTILINKARVKDV